MAAPWEKDPIIRPAQGGVSSPATVPAQTGGVRQIVAPRPKEVAPRYEDDARESQNKAAASEYDPAKAAADAAAAAFAAENAPGKERFSREMDITKQFEALPEVKNFKTALPMYASAIKAADNPVGDMQIITAWAKTYDPAGSVREGDVATAEQAQSYIDSILAQKSNFDGKGRLRPEVRRNFVNEIRNRASRYGDQFAPIWQNYRQRAQAAGLDPDQALGQHPALPFRAVEEEFLGRPIVDRGERPQPQLDARGNPAIPMGQGEFGAPTETAVPIAPEQRAKWDAFMTGFQKGQLTPDTAATAWLNITGRPLVNAEAVVEHFNKTGEWSPETQYQPPDISDRRNEQSGGVMETLDAGVRGAADVLTLGLADEVAAVGNTITGGGTYRDNLARERAVDSYDSENNFGARTTGQVAAGFMIPTAAAASARAAAVQAIRNGGTRAEAMAAARAAATGQMTREGAAFGGGYGYGSSEGDALSLESVVDAAIGTAVGAAGGQIVGRGAGALGARKEAGREAGRIADRLGIEPTPATVGADSAHALQMGFGNAPGSAGIVRTGVERENAQLADAARRAAGRLGPVSTREQAGDAIVRGTVAFDRASSRRGNQLYAERDRLMGGAETPVPLNEAQAALTRFSDMFPTSPVLQSLREHPAIRRLGAVLDESTSEAFQQDQQLRGMGINPGGPPTTPDPTLTLSEAADALSWMRSVLRNARKNNLSTDQIERQVGEVEQAIENDLMRVAREADISAGRTPGADGSATAAQRTADRYWAEKKRITDRVLATASKSSRDDVGTPSERVFTQMATDMNRKGGNLTRLRDAWRTLPQGARRSFAATKFDELGRANPSAQNEVGSEWSFNTFLTNWDNLDDVARRMVFGGQGVAREIQDIGRYAARLRDLDKSRNFSNTARNTLAGAYMLAVGEPMIRGDLATAGRNAAALPVAAISSAAFMASPAMRRWVRDSLGALVRRDESQLARQTRRLAVIARQEPAIAADALNLQEQILGAKEGDVRP